MMNASGLVTDSVTEAQYRAPGRGVAARVTPD